MRVFSSHQLLSMVTMRILNWELEQLLRTAEMGPLLQTAVRSSGWELESWALDRVYSHPNGDTSARFETTVSGSPVTLVACTRDLSERERRRLGAVRCEAGVGALHIWAHPSDPELPGLSVVEDREALTDRLSAALRTEVSVQEAQMVVLRPLRRAVYRLSATSGTGPRTVFIKVVRPHKVPELLARHRACTLTPATVDLGEGMLLMEQAPGLALTELLHQPSAPHPGVRVDPGAVLSALQAVTPRALDLRPRTPPADRFDDALGSLVVAGADPSRLETLTRNITAHLDRSAVKHVPTHGDFHPANLFMAPDGQRPTALIDADTVGPGRRRDDLATMLAHLLALPSFDAVGYCEVPRFAADMWHHAADRGNEDLLGRTAASLLSLAPGARTLGQLDYYIGEAERILQTGAITPAEPPLME